MWYYLAKMSKAKKVNSQAKQSTKPKPRVAKVKAQKKAAAEPAIVLEVKRHWFGLVSIYALMITGILAFFLLALFIDDFWRDNFALLVLAALMLAAIVYILFIFISEIYNSNKLIIDDHEVRQVAREALFMTKSSVLALANVEDVTCVRNGVFAHIFNYGVLNIETAGEQANFKFRYCPNPEECARILMEARESYLVSTKQDQVLR